MWGRSGRPATRAAARRNGRGRIERRCRCRPPLRGMARASLAAASMILAPSFDGGCGRKCPSSIRYFASWNSHHLCAMRPCRLPLPNYWHHQEEERRTRSPPSASVPHPSTAPRGGRRRTGTSSSSPRRRPAWDRRRRTAPQEAARRSGGAGGARGLGAAPRRDAAPALPLPSRSGLLRPREEEARQGGCCRRATRRTDGRTGFRTRPNCRYWRRFRFRPRPRRRRRRAAARSRRPPRVAGAGCRSCRCRSASVARRPVRVGGCAVGSARGGVASSTGGRGLARPWCSLCRCSEVERRA
mmetsp:Transcript_31068/g.66137  ORF Transcript_31068/g.66137 Transcript_31068/m.66137 type:complete len:299 (-) Transcript_31068:36-932(-)